MRYRIAREGVDTVVGNHLEVGSLKWTDRPLVVLYGSGLDPKHRLGKATDLLREENGDITAEVEWNDQGSQLLDDFRVNEEGGSYLTIFANKVTDKQHNGQRIVEDAHLRSVFITLESDPWAEA